MYKLFISREIILSSECNSVFSKISGHLSVRFFVSPSILSNYFDDVLFRWSYELPGKERTGRSGVPCLCSFAKPYSLAGCAPVDLNLVYSASLISSFFMASNSLSFSIFIITLSQILPLTKLFCLNCSACSFSAIIEEVISGSTSLWMLCKLSEDPKLFGNKAETVRLK